MCGIAGFTQFSTQWGNQQTLKMMGSRIRHRGPDASGEYLEAQVGLSHRRLSIIDLTDAGKQPMHSADDQLVITFNGEIYNFLELRAELEQQGYSFKSQTDTEVLLALYKLHGTGLLEKINGMFAFAIWDKQSKSLFAARDRIGKKPFYYHVRDNDIVFASELKALLELENIPKKIRLDAVYDYFAYQYVPDPKTIFNDIFKLEPGHYIIVSENGIEKHKYWDISIQESHNGTEFECEDKLLQLLEGSTKRRMISDVPLGAFLSGGIDSSGIVALMAGSSDSPVTTCSIGFDDNRYNETEFAQLVAEKFNTDHHEFSVQGSVLNNFAEIASFFDEPFADPSLVPTYFVSKLARRQVTVALAGDGGDEIFAGYEKYSTDQIENRLRECFPRCIRKNIFPFVSRLSGKLNISLFRRASSLFNSLSCDPDMGFYITNSMISDQQWEELIQTHVRDQLGAYHPSRITTDYYHALSNTDHLSRILYTDLKTYLPGDILVKVDRMSMANSLEVRAPILDKEILEFMAGMPSELKIRNGEKKYLLKKVFGKLLPQEVLSRKKMGFSVPLSSWLRNELKEFSECKLLKPSHGLTDIFRANIIEKLWHEHQSQRKDHSTILWSMLMYQVWWDTYMDADEAG